jgi:hypothetical protein
VREDQNKKSNKQQNADSRKKTAAEDLIQTSMYFENTNVRSNTSMYLFFPKENYRVYNFWVEL